MTYTQQLKNEVELYLKNLDEYEAVAPKALEILSRAAAAMRENREQAIRQTEDALKENSARKERLHEIQEKLKKVAGDVKSSIETYMSYSVTILEQRTKKKRERLRESRKGDLAENEAQTQERYEKLLAVRQEYADEFAEISGDPKEVEKKLDEQAEQQGAKLTKLKTERGDGRLLPMLEGEEKQTVERFLRILPHVHIEVNVSRAEAYSELLRLYALFTRRKETAECAPPMSEGAVSIVCTELFWKILRKIVNRNESLRKDLWQTAYTVEPLQGFVMHGTQVGDGLVFELPNPNFVWETEILLFSRNEMQCVLKEIENFPNADLPELVSHLSDLSETNNAEQGAFQSDLAEFTRLYRETPEERLVTEQRYYQQKLLEQAEEKNRILQQQIDDEQERYEQEQREEERRYRREMKERAREREEQKRREREEERQQWEAREQAQRNERARKRTEAFETRRQCRFCANYGHCKLAGQRPNCPSFRPQ